MLVLITPLEFPVDLNAGSADGRPEGLHLSTVIADLDNTVNHKGRRVSFAGASEKERQRALRYFEAGFMWEQVFQRQWQRRMRKHLRRARFELTYQCHGIRGGGMWMTPDAIDEDEWALWEFKLTWKTVKRLAELDSDPSFWPWKVQIGCYLRTLKMTRCYLVPFFVNGDYSEPRVPDVRLLRLDFDAAELERNWQMVMNHKAGMIKKGLIAA